LSILFFRKEHFTMNELKRTPLYERHLAMGAKMVAFGGWEMPLYYPEGIVGEHLSTRKGAGLFDISHMGRFVIRGSGARRFLQHALTNNADALDAQWTSGQYTIIANDSGGAVDDAYLYLLENGDHLLVVNAANREKDLAHLNRCLKDFEDVNIEDRTESMAMLSLQGPMSRALLEGLITQGAIPEPLRNAMRTFFVEDIRIDAARTGYTGEPLCFELFMDRDKVGPLWEKLIERGATAAGLGARDTLRLEAGLTLYGHELGVDPEGLEIPVFAVPGARIGVSFSARKGDFVGRKPLETQFRAYERILFRDYSLINDLPRLVQPVALTGRGIARAGARVLKDGRLSGYVTSGTMVPAWVFDGLGFGGRPTDGHELRPLCLAYMDSRIVEDDRVFIDVRGKLVEAVVVPYHLRSEAPPHARPIFVGRESEAKAVPDAPALSKVQDLLRKTIENTRWRQHECINLIPSEMTPSPMVRLLSVMDPAFRYAEHREIKAFYELDVFYYQGTDFIAEVERLVEEEFKRFLGCPEVETRLISGQLANMAVFSGMVDYINRADRKREPRRIGQVMNNHIIKGGHLSAQPMGALRDYVARDPVTDRPAVVNFPVLGDNPHRIDVGAALALIDRYRPELVIFGKSMFIHKEPVAEIRRFIDDQGINAVIMYDAAHVLGLLGPHFQQPFEEGADLVTASTHKTFFGTQRGVIGSRFEEQEERYDLWEAIVRRTFPGSVSNHHLGTLLGLLMAAYEMNHFRDPYQRQVIANAKAFARALKEGGLDVAGDPAVEFTETHQVLINVGYGRGPLAAKQLERNNIICNYQAAPSDEGFTVASSLRMGVAEMTRFGMGPEDFRTLAGLIRDVLTKGTDVKEETKRLRGRFLELQFCFRKEDCGDLMDQLSRWV
jgi:aminomethyltransferase